MINTGFIMSTSKNDEEDDVPFLQRKQIFTNEYVNLLFEKTQRRFADGEREYQISGMLFRTFSEIDLWEMMQICKSLDTRSKILPIDP